ncbi:MAG TPA: hypothetical protein VEA79_12675 [Phenylobacterium sp.]|nr:hypothetical protein [Phenylobacterium sp.]
MAHTRAWRNFKRMQDSTVAAASLIYVGAAMHAVRVLPEGVRLTLGSLLILPAAFLIASVVLPLAVAPVRRLLARYVWMSFLSGFGQTVISVLTGLGLLFVAAAFIWWQVAVFAEIGRFPIGLFAGYASGIGILIAQASLARRLERDPEVARRIEERG